MSKSRYAGMTLNERLFAAGLTARFDEALSTRDRATIEELLVVVGTEPNLANVLLSEKYECWFCGKGIERADGPALSIDMWELWSATAEDGPSQTIYAHFLCAQTRMKGASMDIERDVFFPDESSN